MKMTFDLQHLQHHHLIYEVINKWKSRTSQWRKNLQKSNTKNFNQIL